MVPPSNPNLPTGTKPSQNAEDFLNLRDEIHQLSSTLESLDDAVLENAHLQNFQNPAEGQLNLPVIDDPLRVLHHFFQLTSHRFSWSEFFSSLKQLGFTKFLFQLKVYEVDLQGQHLTLIADSLHPVFDATEQPMIEIGPASNNLGKAAFLNDILYFEECPAQQENSEQTLAPSQAAQLLIPLKDDTKLIGIVEITFESKIEFQSVSSQFIALLSSLITRALLHQLREADFLEHRERLELISHGLQSGIIEWNQTNGTLWFSRQFLQSLSYNQNDFPPTSESLFNLIHPDDKPQLQTALKEFGHRQAVESNVRIASRSGDFKWFQARFEPLVNKYQHRVYVCFFTNIHEKKIAELELKESKRLFAEAARLAKIGAWEWEINTDHFHWSKELLALYNLPSENINKSSKDFLNSTHPEDVDFLQESLKEVIGNKKSSTFRYRIVVDDKIKTLETLAYFVQDTKEKSARLIGTCQDITERVFAENERKLLESQRVQTQKLESLGGLASRVAHDFNNILTVILGSAQAIQFLPPEKEEKRLEFAQKIVNASKTAAQLCKQMMDFAGHTTGKKVTIRLSMIIVCIIDLLSKAVNKSITLEQKFYEGDDFIFADETQLIQVFMNLLKNASDAIGDRGGKITLETGIVKISSPINNHTLPLGEIKPGIYCYAEVEDDGPGMSPEVQARIFEPSFTTKHDGHGFGLSGVLGIVKSHNGSLALITKPGAGALFRILIPYQPIILGETTAELNIPEDSSLQIMISLADEYSEASIRSTILHLCPSVPCHNFHELNQEKIKLKSKQHVVLIFDERTEFSALKEVSEKLSMHQQQYLYLTSQNESELPAWLDQFGVDHIVKKGCTIDEFSSALNDVINNP
ncbi:MAG: PAS domain-containing protein [Sumerlaeia bacterium]